MRIYGSKDDLVSHLKGAATVTNGDVRLDNEDKFRDNVLDTLTANAALNPSKDLKGLSRFAIKSVASQLGIIPASIQGLYEMRGRGQCQGFTVPAINIRGMPYELNRAILRSAKKIRGSAVIFELAKSEMGYTDQLTHEFAAIVIAAAIREQYRGPLFIQGDHYQVNAGKYKADRDKEISGLKDLIRRAIAAGIYNIDIDTSTLVTLDKPSVKEQQQLNYEVGVELTDYVRQLEPQGITISVGGEIGEVGKTNSTEEELRAYMDNFNEHLAQKNKKYKTISKISIQTGTTHGGVPMPDGSVAEVQLDFATLENLSRISRKDYGLAGAVQHGASTLPADLFGKFPDLETAEIHLATDFQNMMYESKHFPRSLRDEIYTHLRNTCAEEKKAGETDEQFIYKTRKKGFGGKFKAKFWDLGEDIKTAIRGELETKMDFLFDKLRIKNTEDLIARSIQPVAVKPDLQNEIENA